MPDINELNNINVPDINMPDINESSNIDELTKNDIDVYLPISEIPQRFPHYCQKMCTAWNSYISQCGGFIMQRKFCSHSVSKITEKINERKKVHGERWWK